MLLSQRRRRTRYDLGQSPRGPRAIRQIIVIVLALLVIYLVASRILRFFGVGNPVERTGSVVSMENGSTVNVSVDGGDWQKAEDGMKIYAGDALSTSSTSHATIAYFDGTLIRLDERTDAKLDASNHGKEESTIAMTLRQGALFVRVPAHATLSGSVTRTITTPNFTFTLPARTQALVTPVSLMVFSAEGQGVTVTTSGHEPIIIGEGQKWIVVDPKVLKTDLYAYRSPLDAASARAPFVTESQAKMAIQASHTGSVLLPAGDILTLTSPSLGATMDSGTIQVSGKVDSSVTRVTLNGQDVPLDATSLTFNQTMAPPDGKDDVLVTVQALDQNGTILAEVKRNVKRVPRIFAAPTIDSPANGGQTYRTQSQEFVIRGHAPAGATGVMVNDYALQLFDAQKGTWSYLAAVRLANLKPGINTYDVYALYGDGSAQKKSVASTLTILLEDGPVGVVATASSAGSAGSSVSSKPVLNNAPLKPGSITVTAPAAGTSANLSGTGALIEGTTSSDTDTLWVNDYRLQLYKPGKTAWNYIASPDLKNLKPGSNAFVIVSRNAKGEVLDKFTYTIEYTK